MASKAKRSKKSWVPNSLEDPVHNLIGYGVLLILVVVVLFVVLALKQ